MAGSPTSGARPRVGVLALQGDFREHIASLTELGADVVPLRRPEEIETLDGVVIPGGESSVMDKLSRAFGVAEPLADAIRAGLPTYGTCAGMIMLSSRITDGISGQQTLDVLDTTVRRNAFGAQNDSFEIDIPMPDLGEAPVHAVFIRAPVVEQRGDDVHVLGALPDGQVVAVQQGNVIASAFHPEVAGEDRFHRRFLDLVRTA
ncbi:glutamine amidotransferase subunit PdxT [Curtobacterium sp. MCBA15_007]|uniref:pyridoxal 5'-phosphate synthase glutaminase subunit PdxT n=1 Tax=Curtobacterium TaxID=2034 RepID=UPI00038218D1|nr:MULTISPECIES: pyridoxal 5'-phosphate synthase glutaminase subunit PdxT [Curtobacterium]EYT66745.1 glutamine amidotransferase [Curtobacterium flaccumfaciens UCD-AKU]MBT1618462.1 pyridoxal 5'-phosphate synthase glutaminase subunit PdxT [Curtobacterium flaccumfaciens pv. poinsettiae]MCS6565435.1 pyridoxal 5'-phosphate synthase glutaminase subunit PdxT [Curtobacterium flaccumfaciens pv. flaccumfaciens]MCU0114392.1 pyridoxal 5'-phosphate synthase glutaminase subunit PdxT [Curtobacterium flaccumfa